MQKIALIDADGVTIGLLSEWLNLYNIDYGDNLSPNDITAWELDRFVKPECGKKIYKYLEYPNLYDNAKLLPHAATNIKLLRYWGIKVVFLSAGIYCIGKYNLRKREGLIQSESEMIVASDKSLVRGDFMIDDYHKNIDAFYECNPNGIGILYNAPYNIEQEGYIRAGTWNEASFIIRNELISFVRKGETAL